jgi:hypothetical protein
MSRFGMSRAPSSAKMPLESYDGRYITESTPLDGSASATEDATVIARMISRRMFDR